LISGARGGFEVDEADGIAEVGAANEVDDAEADEVIAVVTTLTNSEAIGSSSAVANERMRSSSWKTVTHLDRSLS